MLYEVITIALQFIQETAIFKEHQMGMENRGIILRQTFGDPFFQKQSLNAGFFQGQVEFL